MEKKLLYKKRGAWCNEKEDWKNTEKTKKLSTNNDKITKQQWRRWKKKVETLIWITNVNSSKKYFNKMLKKRGNTFTYMQHKERLDQRSIWANFQQHSNWPWWSALALPRLPDMVDSVNDGVPSVQVAVLRLEVPIDKWEGVPWLTGLESYS